MGLSCCAFGLSMSATRLGAVVFLHRGLNTNIKHGETTENIEEYKKCIG